MRQQFLATTPKDTNVLLVGLSLEIDKGIKIIKAKEIFNLEYRNPTYKLSIELPVLYQQVLQS